MPHNHGNYMRRTSISQFDNEARQKMYSMLMADEGMSRKQIAKSFKATYNVINDVLAWGIKQERINERKAKEMRIKKETDELLILPKDELQHSILAWQARQVLTIGDVYVEAGQIYSKEDNLKVKV